MICHNIHTYIYIEEYICNNACKQLYIKNKETIANKEIILSKSPARVVYINYKL